jgi:hypothetical protein
MLWAADYNTGLEYGSKERRRGNTGGGQLTGSSNR